MRFANMKSSILVLLYAILAEVATDVPSCKQTIRFERIVHRENRRPGCPKGHRVCHQDGEPVYMCEKCGANAFQPNFNYEFDNCKQRKLCESRYKMEYEFNGTITHDTICRCKIGYKTHSVYHWMCIFDACPPRTKKDDAGNCVKQPDYEGSSTNGLSSATAGPKSLYSIGIKETDLSLKEVPTRKPVENKGNRVKNSNLWPILLLGYFLLNYK